MKTFVLRTVQDKRDALNYLYNLRSERIMRVEIKLQTRSLEQNDTYWGIWLEAIKDATGDSAKAWHLRFKRMFAPVRLYEAGGVVMEETETTTDMNTKEFSEYCDHINQWCVENLGFALPEPDPSKSKRKRGK